MPLLRLLAPIDVHDGAARVSLRLPRSRSMPPSLRAMRTAPDDAEPSQLYQFSKCEAGEPPCPTDANAHPASFEVQA